MPKTPENASVVQRDVSQIIANNSNPPADPSADPPADPPADPQTDQDPPADPTTEKDPPADPPANLNLEGGEEKPGAAEPVSVDETGNANIDAVGQMLAEKGLADAQDIMDDFLENGEVSLANKAKMIDALGEGVAAMAFKQLEDAATAIINEAKADSKATMDYANEKFSGVDGETTWQQIQDYVKSGEGNFSKEDIAAMNSMLEQGGLAAKLVIDKIHAVYTADANNSVPGQLLEGDAGNNGATFEPISRLDYISQMDSAVAKYGEDSYQVRELNRRRQLTMRRGG